MNNKKVKGFTLIELLIVIAIIGILATIAVISLQNARVKSRDARRLSDVDQMQTALTLYYRDKGKYPAISDFVAGGSLIATTSAGTVTYMALIPTAPTPADGTCSNSDNAYHYSPSSDFKKYTIYYCLGEKTADVGSGNHAATSDGINAAPAWSLLGVYDGYVSDTTVVNGVPYISYNLGPQDGYHGFVKRYVNGNWENVGLGNTGISTGSAVSVYLKTAENGDLYAFYITFDGGSHVVAAKYTGNGATGWEALGDSSFFPPSSTSLTASWTIKNNTVYAIYNYSDGNIVAAKFNGSSWVQIGSIIAGNYIDIAGIAVNDDNEVYVMYHKKSDYGIYVDKFNSGTSSWEHVGGYADSDYGFSSQEHNLKIVAGKPCVFSRAQAYSSYTLHAMCSDGSSWAPLGYNLNPYGPSGFVSTYNPSYISVDYSGGKVYVAYKDANQDGKISILQNGLKTGEEWSEVSYPGLSDGVISASNMFIDNSGVLYLSYNDGGKTYIKKYAR
ncbi:MAG: type II secretion system protein [Candidatus Falkowbacteria bacterium]